MIIDKETGNTLTVKLAESNRMAFPVYILQTSPEGKNQGVLGFGNTLDAWTVIQELHKSERITIIEANFLTQQADQLDSLIIRYSSGFWQLKGNKA